VASPQSDQETSYAQDRYRDAFRTAFSAALLSLDDRDKNLLRQHYLDGLTLDRLGVLYRTHRATAARWLAAAKQQLLDRTRSHLMGQLRVPLADCDSIIRLVKSQFDLTVYRLFAAVEPRDRALSCAAGRTRPSADRATGPGRAPARAPGRPPPP